ncbi:MAG TPA: adenylate/guanylate cyclase domain-containing protein [Candidatus Binataceae bacterium]|nr:adenylate/guanylate cyclase domain-containing protein [Candidatus Binataceae bacterium]
MADAANEVAWRLQRALLAYVRQEFSSPAAAIYGYAELMLEDAASRGPREVLDDLERIRQAGADLHALIEGLLDPAAIAHRAAQSDFAGFRRQLQHDLRNPINAIKGYAEMLLEDEQERGASALAADLNKLLEAALKLLSDIDALVDFTLRETDEGGGELPQPQVRLAERAEAARRTIQSMAGSTRANRPQPSRILIVDDTAANRELLSRRLSRDGHRISTAADGAQALELIVAQEFDLILLDLMMPGLSGFEVLQRVKANAQRRHIPVIMISALDEIDSIVGCIEAGAEDYLPKPFNPILLQARIGSSLERKHLRDREQAYLADLRVEKQRSDNLLLNILPRPIVDRIQAGETTIADRFQNVTVLFADIVNFTPRSARMASTELVEMLNDIFSSFDRLSLELGVEKVKTIGDAYMAVAGLPQPRSDHAAVMARMALRMLDLSGEYRKRYGELELRLGLHSGAVVAGIIGTHKFSYDIWGDTVNIASRMESQGLPGRIQISPQTYALLGEEFELEPRGQIEIKGKGLMTTYFLRGLRTALTA